MGVDPPTLREIESAARRLADVLAPAPLVPHAGAGAPPILLKHEIHQCVGCFKIRGVYNAVATLDDAARGRGLLTVSAGNTAKALAWCGRRFGVRARSIMPDTAPATKIDAVRRLGGEPVLVPVAEVFRFLQTHAWEAEPDAFIHPWTNRDVMIGHGTMGLEILAESPEVDTVIVPVGGGGLLGGVGTALRLMRPEVRIVAVEPEGCPALHASIAAGAARSVACRTICDGVAVPYVTEEMFPILRDLADETVLVSERDVRAAVRLLALHDHVVAEPSGALALAAALQLPPARRGTTVCLVTGGSIDPVLLAEILSAS